MQQGVDQNAPFVHWWFCESDIVCQMPECYGEQLCCCMYRCTCVDAVQHFGYFCCKHVHLLCILLRRQVSIKTRPDCQGEIPIDDGILGFSKSEPIYAPALQDDGATIPKATELQQFKNQV